MADPKVMNFFEHQEQARAGTKKLIFLFALAVALILVALYFVAQIILWFSIQYDPDTKIVQPFDWWNPMIFAATAIGTLLFIGVASLYKIIGLRDGGSAVAEMLGGRQVTGDSNDPKERRLLNVVEEMAIASGVPMPLVYVLDREQGINAFAAGYSTADAAVAVTRGTLERLSRDELQGVIAHEFSHVLNGDMRLNIKLIGVLFGILAIGIIGQYMLRAQFYSGRSRRGGGGALVIGGLLIMLVGYIGTFIGRLIQSAVSRQKEFLADSSAVQFTRNPLGIAGALKKIGGFEGGSRIQSPAAGEVSHLFFGQGEKVSLFTGLLATHPPLDERIRRIEPSFGGDYSKRAPKKGPAIKAAGASPVSGFSGSATTSFQAGSVIGQVGNPTPDHVAASAWVLLLIPEPLKDAVRRTDQAQCAVFALLLDADPAERAKQVAILEGELESEQARQVLELFNAMRTLDPLARLPLVDLALPALRKLGFDELGRFLSRIQALISADSKVTLFEFCVQWMIGHRLGGKARTGKIAFTSIRPLRQNILVLLAAFARGGNLDDADAARQAFERGTERIPKLGNEKDSFDFDKAPGLGDVSLALDRLALSSYAIREKVIDAAAHCAFADEQVTLEEANLLRVVSMALDCPLPPFLPEL